MWQRAPQLSKPSPWHVALPRAQLGVTVPVVMVQTSYVTPVALRALADVDALINRLSELNVIDQVRNIARTTIIHQNIAVGEWLIPAVRGV